MCNWVTLLYTWDIVNQLYFNKKIKVKKIVIIIDTLNSVIALDLSRR